MKANTVCVPFALLLFVFATTDSSTQANDARPPNVLLIPIDDLNDWVGCLGGHPQSLTPNIDALANPEALDLFKDLPELQN